MSDDSGVDFASFFTAGAMVFFDPVLRSHLAALAIDVQSLSFVSDLDAQSLSVEDIFLTWGARRNRCVRTLAQVWSLPHVSQTGSTSPQQSDKQNPGRLLVEQGFADHILSDTDLIKIAGAVVPGWPMGAPTKAFGFEGSAEALFLDRDGVVIEDCGYIQDPKDVVVRPFIIPTIRNANRAGIPVVLVTNQSGVARGYFTEEQFEHVQAEMSRQLAVQGCRIDHVFKAFGHPQAKLTKYRRYTQLRKPRPGMFFQAAQIHGLDLKKSKMIGDRALDGLAAFNAGLAQFELAASEYCEEELIKLQNICKKIDCENFNILSLNE